MTRLLALLVASTLAVTPTANVVCRAVCTPGTTAVDARACHELGPSPVDGVLLSAVGCQRDVETAAPPTGEARNLVAPAPLANVKVPAFAHAAVLKVTHHTSPAVRLHPTQADHSTVVLRI